MLKCTALGFLILLVGCGSGGSSESGSGNSGSGGSGNSGVSGAGGSISFVVGVGTTMSAGSGSGGGAACGNSLLAKIRDFTPMHPDFESFPGGPLDGIVLDTLGPDGKPVYAHPGSTSQTTGPTEFAQWY